MLHEARRRWVGLALPVLLVALRSADAKDTAPPKRGPIAGVSGGRLLFHG